MYAILVLSFIISNIPHIDSCFGGSKVTKQPLVLGCYYGAWAQYREGLGEFTPLNYEPGYCTHVFYAFTVMSNEFKLVNFDPKDDEGFQDWANIKKQKQPDLKLILSMGGKQYGQSLNGNALLKQMASRATSRTQFMQSVAWKVRSIGFDGFDLHWEYPDADDKANFATLITEMRAYFEAEATQKKLPRLLFTVSVAGGSSKMDQIYDTDKLVKAVDYVNLMTYDYHGGWEQQTGFNSPLYDRNNDKKSVENSAKHYIDIGVPKSKMLIGFAAYGRGYTLANPNNYTVGAPAIGPSPAQKYTKEEGYAAYYEICDLLDNQGFKEYLDESQEA